MSTRLAPVSPAKLPEKTARRARAPVHLGQSPHEAAVSDFEQSLICAAEGFYRFVGLLLGPQARKYRLAGPDNVILQQLVGAAEPRSVTDLARFANRDDIANIQYSLRKLIQAGLIEKSPGSTNRDSRYQVTQHGQQVTSAFLAVRRELLMQPSAQIREFDAQLRAAAQAVSLMASLYDHATRKITARQSIRTAA
jgi:predicted MarR family transcription regulator